ncbi:MAG: hypothetical protein JNM93_01860 [Bacteriovoracaceae bacterium]|nr:hypothetical protein [Bacteriovoracaceae bacterium]
MRILLIFMLCILYISTYRSNASSYLATEVGCSKWKERKMMDFAEQAEISEFVSKSREFFSRMEKVESATEYNNHFSQEFVLSRKISSNGQFRPEFQNAWDPSKMVTKKIIKPMYSKLTSKNSGINSIFDTQLNLLELHFVMSYQKDTHDIKTEITHVYDDGSKMTFPFEEYVSFKLPKSCKLEFKVSELNYFKSDVIIKEIVRLPARVKPVEEAMVEATEDDLTEK